jgi:uncharacterized membrane protein
MIFSIDTIVYVILILVGIIGSYLSLKISHGELAIGYAAVSGILTTTLWLCILKYSQNNVVSVSGSFDALSTLGYFLGFVIFGQQLSLTQMIGGFLIIVGIFLINK